MTASAPGKPSPIVGRVLYASAALMLLFSILAFNDRLPFDTSPEARRVLGPALFFAGFFDMFLAKAMTRRAR
jgi:hypothetical protein